MQKVHYNLFSFTNIIDSLAVTANYIAFQLSFKISPVMGCALLFLLSLYMSLKFIKVNKIRNLYKFSFS